ncbi:hypothetical protein MKEN_00816400 [Mycena kentingensis (nom. inval.)]|nr:hypothetical protein MKEN_00816400 [Mycena kentingensis (nom. inval.)]
MPPTLDSSRIATLLHHLNAPAQPIPDHLLSGDLKLRHTVVGITPEEPAYLLWPSDEQQRVIHALDAFQQSPWDDSRCKFSVRYTADTLPLAHVEITPDLRLILQFEDETWNYHNAALMPFPSDSTLTPREPPSAEADNEDTQESADSYWDSYDDESGGGDKEESRNTRKEMDYWARYNGTADSEIPSPGPAPEMETVNYSYGTMHPATDKMDLVADRLELLARREEDGLKAAIRGVWQLWGRHDKETFVRVVNEVVAE